MIKILKGFIILKLKINIEKNLAINLKKSLMGLGLLSALASCQSIAHIQPGSERLRVFATEPKGCVFVGEIPSVQENSLTPAALSQEVEMDLNTRVELRNKAYALGGNVIVFMNNHKKNTDVSANKSSKPESASAGNSASNSAQKNEADTSEKKVVTVFLATVFKCPSSIVNQ